MIVLNYTGEEVSRGVVQENAGSIAWQAYSDAEWGIDCRFPDGPFYAICRLRFYRQR
ncbi:hypothetical protein [Candidatus Minimicrobia naudis]